MEGQIFPNQFIRAGKEFSTLEKWVPAPLFRRKFTVSQEIFDKLQKAELVIGACGFYELYLNGKNITKGVLAPYISNPDDLVYFDKVVLLDREDNDRTDENGSSGCQKNAREIEYNNCEVDKGSNAYNILQAGDNVIGVWLGNGFMNNPGGFVWDFDKASWRGAPCFAMELKMMLEDGREICIGADEDFLTAPSPILFDDYRIGEVYDARLEETVEGWNLPEYDDSFWKEAEAAPAPRGEARFCMAEPIREVATYQPKEIYRVADGWLFDFGLNTAGVSCLKIKGNPGQKITLHHGDHLLDDGSLDVENTTCDTSLETNLDVYICKGGQEEIFRPRFAYHGFQYVYAEGLEEHQVSQDTLTYIEMYSDLKERGGFRCSDECLNKIQEATRRSTLSNFYYFPNDCPQREKNGWTADAALSAEHTLLNVEAEHSYREWMRSICKAQREDGALPGIVPTGGWGFQWGNGPAWDCVLTWLPYFVYQYRGDREIVKENAHAIIAYLEYLASHRREDGLLCISIGVGDWCQADRESDAYDAPLEVTDTLISMDIAQKAAYLFSELGMECHRQFAVQLAAELREAARRELIDPDNLLIKGNCQTCQALALATGLLEEEEKQEAFARLLELIEKAGRVLAVGVVGGRNLFHVLSEFGYSDLAYEMIVGPQFPSYGYWIAKGATALWEDFRRDGEIVHSKNHHFWGDVSHWFIGEVGGIRYGREKGKGVLRIAPCFLKALDWAEAWHQAPEGRIFVKWERKEQNILMTLEVPEGLEGVIELEGRTGVQGKDGEFVCFEDGSVQKPACSGCYQVLVQNSTEK